MGMAGGLFFLDGRFFLIMSLLSMRLRGAGGAASFFPKPIGGNGSPRFGAESISFPDTG